MDENLLAVRKWARFSFWEDKVGINMVGSFWGVEESTIEVDSDDLSIMVKLWGLGHSQVKWEEWVENWDHESVYIIGSEKSVEDFNFLVNSFNNMWESSLNSMKNWLVEEINHALEDLAGKFEVKIIDINEA